MPFLVRPAPHPVLFVIPNRALMNNHQSELAERLGEGQFLIYSEVDELMATLRRVLRKDRLEQHRQLLWQVQDRLRAIRTGLHHRPSGEGEDQKEQERLSRVGEEGSITVALQRVHTGNSEKTARETLRPSMEREAEVASAHAITGASMMGVGGLAHPCCEAARELAAEEQQLRQWWRDLVTMTTTTTRTMRADGDEDDEYEDGDGDDEDEDVDYLACPPPLRVFTGPNVTAVRSALSIPLTGKLTLGI